MPPGFKDFCPRLCVSANGLSNELRTAGYSCSTTIAADADALGKLASGSSAHDGIVIWRNVADKMMLDRLRESPRPYVFMQDDRPMLQEESRVTLDEHAGVEDGVKWLLASGRKRFAVYGAGPHAGLYRKVFRDIGLPFCDENTFKVQAVESYEIFAAAYASADVFLRRDPPFDAICCTSDLVALGLSKRLEENGVKVGVDVSLMGIDDGARLAGTPEGGCAISAVDFQPDEIGREAARLILNLIGDGRMKGSASSLKSKFILRG